MHVDNLIKDVSIHAPREGCDYYLSSTTREGSGFNSRTPGGVRLKIKDLIVTLLEVSIHAPREGCDRL